MKKENKIKEKSFPENQVLVVLESMRKEIQLVAEGQVGINEKFDGIDKRFDGIDQRLDKMDQRFDGIDQRLDKIDQRFDGIDQRLDKMDKRFDGIDQRLDKIDQRFDGIDEKFALSFEYLSRIEDEVVNIKEEIKEINKNLEKKADFSKVNLLERRVAKLERDLFRYRQIALKS